MGFICDEVVHLSEQDKKSLMAMVKRYDPSLLKRFPDGTRIRLDSKLPDELIKEMYNFVKRKLNLNEQTL